MKEITCHECGATLPVTASFCDQCGMPVQRSYTDEERVLSSEEASQALEQQDQPLPDDEAAIKAFFLPEKPQQSGPEPVVQQQRSPEASSLLDQPAHPASLFNDESSAYPNHLAPDSPPTRPASLFNDESSSFPGRGSSTNQRTPSQSTPSNRISRRTAVGSALSALALVVGLCKICTSISRSGTTSLYSGGHYTPQINPPTGAVACLGHTDAVLTVGWSPDNRYVASGSKDATVRIWEAGTGKHILTYYGHLRDIQKVAWSPDGKLLASSSFDMTLQIWDASTGKLVHKFQSKNEALGLVIDCAWSPDGKLLAAASLEGTVTVYSLRTREPVLTYKGHAQAANGVAWSPDGKLLASAGLYDQTVQVYKVKTGERVLTHTTTANAVTCVAWSPDGTWLASGEGRTTLLEVVSVVVWNAQTGEKSGSFKNHLYAVNSISWSPDSLSIASTGGESEVQVWNPATGAPLATYHGHAAIATAVAWSPDGRHLVSGSLDKSVQIWPSPLAKWVLSEFKPYLG